MNPVFFFLFLLVICFLCPLFRLSFLVLSLFLSSKNQAPFHLSEKAPDFSLFFVFLQEDVLIHPVDLFFLKVH
jgi:hypothetical protein